MDLFLGSLILDWIRFLGWIGRNALGITRMRMRLHLWSLILYLHVGVAFHVSSLDAETGDEDCQASE